jgi:hypothetical protein
MSVKKKKKEGSETLRERDLPNWGIVYPNKN